MGAFGIQTRAIMCWQYTRSSPSFTALPIHHFPSLHLYNTGHPLVMDCRDRRPGPGYSRQRVVISSEGLEA